MRQQPSQIRIPADRSRTAAALLPRLRFAWFASVAATPVPSLRARIGGGSAVVRQGLVGGMMAVVGTVILVLSWGVSVPHLGPDAGKIFVMRMAAIVTVSAGLILLALAAAQH